MVFLSHWTPKSVNTADPSVGWLLAIVLVVIVAVAICAFAYAWRKYK